ncbi:MAG: glycosyltransferase family 1 protein [Sphingobacteriia bacterium]|jgi:glycosyltransferase involved in cell wall biosynthesis|nr:glycosyltransferase family 1 protein [Sphingobacteriia bacterium]
MNIAILGTRGIPNNYGGFEQLAEYLSVGLIQKGHRVTVYCSSNHIYQKSHWNGVLLKHVFDPEKHLGTVGQFIYDFFSVWHCRKAGYDVVLNLGYTSSAVWLPLLYNQTRIVTNMDGLEWKRTKYKKPVQWFLKRAEAWAVQRSHTLIADSIGIQHYLKQTYNVPSTYIAYGANVYNDPPIKALEPFNLKAFSYNILIARMEPENNIELILDGVVNSNSEMPCLVIGNIVNRFGKYLSKKYAHDARIQFLGPIYDLEVINPLRFYSNLYFHGHSVGGTNPSLLEAMGCNALICAHNNTFNAAVLQQQAYYFNTATDVSVCIERTKKQDAKNQAMLQQNINRITTLFSWKNIIDAYEHILITK